jgi:hypothetical protein
MKKQFCIMGMVCGLVGCQSHIRPYDGAIGYQVQSQQPMRLVFVDEDRFSWSTMSHRAHKACAAILKQPVEQIGIKIQAQATIQQNINIVSAIPVPTTISPASTSSGNSTLNGGAQRLSMQQTDLTAVDSAIRPFKQLTVECQPKS